ncbi:hypothetical protein [Verrucomicrobium spinosum]|uniref:hypothetical protein n=1 Tax=Verrucomicrobium spinosum TaxID=2736 RepID=UPI0012E31B67|nr:hypothetical protein [Verrucomicrobium spinosum]
MSGPGRWWMPLTVMACNAAVSDFSSSVISFTSATASYESGKALPDSIPGLYSFQVLIVDETTSSSPRFARICIT